MRECLRLFDGLKNGDPRLSLGELLHPVDIIPFQAKESRCISDEIAEKYQNGESISDIAKFFGRSKCFVRLRLERAGIKPRSKLNQATHIKSHKQGKQGAKPYYGFCYFEGKVIKDPREYPTLMLIHQRWASKKTIHEIVQELNHKQYPSRTGKTWSWAALQNIIVRFANGEVKISKGGKYEFK